MRPTLPFLLALSLVAVAACVDSPPAEKPVASHDTAPPKPEPVVFVNDAPLMSDRLAAKINELFPFGQFHDGARAERRAEIHRQALEQIVDEELQYQEALRLKLEAPQESIDREYARVRNRFETEEDFLAALQRAGTTTAQARAEAERRALIRAAHERQVKARCGVAEEDARTYYSESPERFVSPEQRHVYSLTLGVEPSASSQEWEAAGRQAEELLAQIRGGADFSALARQHSSDPTASDGGDMGFVHRGQLNEELEAALGDARRGALVGPVRTIYGFHLLKVTETRPPSPVTFAEVRDRLLRELGDKKCQDTRDAWLQHLRAQAKIVVVEPPTADPAAGAPRSPVR